MKKMFLILLCVIFVIFSSISFAQNNSWENDYRIALIKGKTITINTIKNTTSMLSETIVLKRAIKKALDLNAPPCIVMKIAIDFQYNPYYVIKDIYSYGGLLSIDQLCMCATESGINKQIIAKAATDAVSSIGTPIYRRDEIAQSQCLKDIGLGYHTVTNIPPPIKSPVSPNPISISSPDQ